MGAKKKIIVLCHDAGGANILAKLVKSNWHKAFWKMLVSGPAIEIFKREGLHDAHVVNQADKRWGQWLDREPVDLLLTATSWASSIEMEAIAAAKQRHIKTAAFLDHWSNYRQRFGDAFSWKVNLPDWVLVGDQWAYTEAVKQGFPKNKLIKVENPYFTDIRQGIKQQRTKAKGLPHKGQALRVLYLSSPIAAHALKAYHNERYWGFTEFDHVDDLLGIKRLNPAMSLTVRLHPSEKVNKYAYLLKQGVLISDGRQHDLIDDCLRHDVVVGCDTLALVVAVLAGCKVVSYMPGRKLKATLPAAIIKPTPSKRALTIRVNEKTVGQSGKLVLSKNFYQASFVNAVLKRI